MKLRLGIRRARCRTQRCELFARAGLQRLRCSRVQIPRRSTIEVAAPIRAQETTRYVCEGVLDAGLTGLDWVAEHRLGRDTHLRGDPRRPCLLETEFRQRCAGYWPPEDSRFHSPSDFAGATITELVQVTKSYFEKLNVPVKRVEFSWGATEVKPPVLATIVEATETRYSRCAQTACAFSTRCLNRTRN